MSRPNAELLLSFYNLIFKAIHEGGWTQFYTSDAMQHMSPWNFISGYHQLFAKLQENLIGKDSALDFQKFIEGFSIYTKSSFEPRNDNQLPVLWQKGSTCVRDYGHKYGVDADAQAVLFAPSLINRGYVLDLMPGASLFEYLANHNIRPLMVEWGEPNEAEIHFDLSQYVQERLVPLLHDAADFCKRPPIVLGYCMGGILLVEALAQCPNIKGLGLLAVPWDLTEYHRSFQHLVPLLEIYQDQTSFMPDAPIPAWAVQLYFHSLNPLEVQRKFVKLAEGTLNLHQSQKFIAVEDWLNDGVPLSARVAQDLCGLKSDQQSDNKRLFINPSLLPQSVFAVVPAHDRIVPTQSAEALLQFMPQAQVLRPPLGHVGMVVSKQAEKKVWQPLVHWLQTFEAVH